MDQVEECLIEEVQKYEHLYNSSSPHYKDKDKQTINDFHHRPFRPFKNLTPPSVLAMNCTAPFNPKAELLMVHNGLELTQYYKPGFTVQSSTLTEQL